MKYVVFLLAAFTLTFSLKAQISDTQVANKDSSMSTMNSIKALDSRAVNGITFKRAFIDYKSPNAGSLKNLSNFKEYNSGFEIGYVRDFSPNLRLYVPVRVGVFNVGDQKENITFGELDAQAQYRFLTKKRILQPYVLGGAGINTENLDTFNVQIPVGAGLDIRIAKKSFINLQGEYRLSLSEQRNNIQFSIGFIHYFGQGKPGEKKMDEISGKDADGDGVPDDLDLCPNKPGLKEFAGCPDTDGDGIEDDLDECPTIAGSPAAKGCPDRDGDGVADKFDKCPDVAGTSKNGCPDTDKDGVDDFEDRCPNTYGPASNKGCPEIRKEDKETLNIAMRDVQFEHNSATLTNSSYKILGQISTILNSYPEYKIEISGHTDNTGTAEINKKLSEQRARACRDYLISKGLAWSRVASRGYGQSKPIATNETQQGRATNRRVEFKLYLE